MISSAVVIPEPQQDQHHQIQPDDSASLSSPSLKRKFSANIDSDRKRPRISTDSLNYDDAPITTATATPPSAISINATDLTSTPTSATSNTPLPDRKRSTALEEKKRNKRLFSSLLGTLSQTSSTSSAAHKKRDEIEARQRERLIREKEEQEAERKHRQDKLTRRRKKEQNDWEAQAQRLKHQNMRAMAGFLKTKAEPSLFYKPWELRKWEEDTLERQKGEIERRIRLELGQEEDSHKSPPLDGGDRDRKESEKLDMVPELETELINGPKACKTDDQPQDQHSTEHNPGQTGKVDERKNHEKQGDDTTQHDDHHHGEELVEGQEDDVIY